MTRDGLSTLWQRAASFAARAHEGQQRKDGRTPYAAHPTRVALTLTCIFECTDEAIIAAALLHDTIEDCDVDYDDIHEQFGAEVADIVACLSKDMRLIEPVREDAYDAQIAAGPIGARFIKLADVFDNLCEAEGAGSKRSLLKKARRTVELAVGDETLADARERVSDLMVCVERELEQR